MTHEPTTRIVTAGWGPLGSHRYLRQTSPAGQNTYYVERDGQWVQIPAERTVVHPVTREYVAMRDLPWEEADEA
jgi:hypothetical protein